MVVSCHIHVSFSATEYYFVTCNTLCLHIQSQDEQITQLRQDFERQAREIEGKYEKKMRTLRDELDLRRKTEIHEIEERKNGQINSLMKNHEKAFSDIKNYYNDITLNNLALINTLKVSRMGCDLLVVAHFGWILCACFLYYFTWEVR